MEIPAKTRELISKDNYESLLGWIENPVGTLPEWADRFMVSLNAIYMTAKDQPVIRKLKALTEAVAEEEKQREQNSIDYAQKVREETERLYNERKAKEQEKETSAPSKPEHSIASPDDGKLPLPNEDGFMEKGVNSMEVAKAIVHIWKSLDPSLKRGKKISLSFIQTVLYTIYGTELAQRGERLVDEHPMMWQYGPVFPRVFGKMKKEIVSDDTWLNSLREQDPVLHEFITRTVTTMAGKEIRELTERHMTPSSPWGRCHKENGDKWNSRISDKHIASWFKREIEKSRK